MNKGQRRPYVGIVLRIGDFDYYVPLESPKPNHANIKSGGPVLKLDGGRLGLMGFNNMLPVRRHQLLYLDLIETNGMSVQDIRTDALAHRYGAVYVDYLQLVEPENRRETRQEQVAGISQGFQKLAHGSGILVVALSQLSRQKCEGPDNVVEPISAP